MYKRRRTNKRRGLIKSYLRKLSQKLPDGLSTTRKISPQEEEGRIKNEEEGLIKIGQTQTKAKG